MRSIARGLLVLLAALLLTGCTAPVEVTWETETEMNTAGFDLYRGTSPDGPFDVKINKELIAPSDDPLTGKAYSFIDPTARTGVTYYYELREVERNGNVNTFGPISVRAGGLDWRHAAVLAVLAGLVIVLWVVGGRQAERRRRRSTGSVDTTDA